jgi:hypothetical protein
MDEYGNEIESTPLESNDDGQDGGCELSDLSDEDMACLLQDDLDEDTGY